MAVFQDILHPLQIESLCSSALDNMRGNCVPYIPDYASCPRPVMEPSSLCVSTPDRYAHNCVGLYDHMYDNCVRCSPQSVCLPDINDDYQCLPAPSSEFTMLCCVCLCEW